MTRTLRPGPAPADESDERRPALARLQALLTRAAAARVDGTTDEQRAERAVERKVVGLTLETELRAVASRVGGGLALHRDAVLVCVELLEACGEGARAARLLADASLAREAAAAAERAGELEVLEGSLATVHGARERAHAASLAFHQHELALQRGAMTEALGSLRAAAGHRPENGAYRDLLTALESRRPPAGQLRLESNATDGPQGAVVVVQAPAWIGRGEDAAIRVVGAGVSRRHLRVEFVEGRWDVRDAKGAAAWVGAGQPLLAGALDLGASVDGPSFLLQPAGGGNRYVIVPGRATVPLGGARIGVELGAEFPRVFPATGAVLVGGRALPPGGTEVGVGDVLEVAGVPWTVQGS